MFWLSLIQVLLLLCHTRSNPEQPLSLHLSDTPSEQQEQMRCCMEHLYGEAIGKDLGVYLQYASNHPLTQFHVRLFPKPQRDTRWRFHFWPPFFLYTNSWNGVLSDPAYNNRFTSSQSCCLTYSIPWENSVQASQETSASPQQLMMSTGPCSYQIPPALSIIPCEITAIGYYCTNYDHVSRCHKA